MNLILPVIVLTSFLLTILGTGRRCRVLGDATLSGSSAESVTLSSAHRAPRNGSSIRHRFCSFETRQSSDAVIVPRKVAFLLANTVLREHSTLLHADICPNSR